MAVTVPRVQAQERSRAEVYALEGLGTLPGIAGCGCLGVGFAFVGAWIWWGNDNPGQNSGAGAYSLALVSAAALPAAAAYGAAKVGEGLSEGGSRGWAFGGAYVGALALGGLGFFLHRQAVGAFIGWAAGSMVGAVVGYNIGIKHDVSPFGFDSRLRPPSVALTSVELPDHSVEYGVKVQLAGLRF